MTDFAIDTLHKAANRADAPILFIHLIYVYNF